MSAGSSESENTSSLMFSVILFINQRRSENINIPVQAGGGVPVGIEKSPSQLWGQGASWALDPAPQLCEPSSVCPPASVCSRAEGVLAAREVMQRKC